MDLALSLDQLRTLAVVVEEGSFSSAARRLNRSQSAITYAIQKLESVVGAPLFDRGGYRPELTEAGRALLPRARRIIETTADFEQQAKALRQGIEAEVCLVVDACYPTLPVFRTLATFGVTFPSVQVRLYIESMGAALRAVLDGTVDLGFVIDAGGDYEVLAGTSSGAIELWPVVVSSHPLAVRQREQKRPLLDEELRDHLQLVLTDQSELTKGRDFGVVGTRTWRIGDLGAKHAMLLAGLGWGSMPLHMVEADLLAGRLVVLDTARWSGGREPKLGTLIVHRRDRPLGTATAWLRDRMLNPALLDEAGDAA